MHTHTTQLNKNTYTLAYIFISECMVMPMTIRLNDKEQEDIRKKAVEINKLLIQKGMQPLKDSELVHIIIEKSISYLEVTAKGEVKLARDNI